MSEDQFDCFYTLWRLYLHMRAWECPEFTEIDQQSRDDFTQLVSAGKLFEAVENCKRLVLRSGLDVPGDWLNVLCACRVREGEPLPQSERDHLGRITTAMYPTLVKLDAADPRVAEHYAGILQGAKNDKHARPQKHQPSPADPRVEWSVQMSKTELARRLTGEHNARPRKIEALLQRYGAEQVTDRQWRVRLDTMDTATRKRITAE